MPSEGRRQLTYGGIALLALCLLLPAPATAKHGTNDTCALPADLQQQIAKRYPGRTVVTLSDLSDQDKLTFQKEHGNDCPGLANVDFYGDGKPTLALALVTKSVPAGKTELVVAHKVGAVWNAETVETTDGPVPVVWREKPGVYVDVYRQKKIRSTRPVIVFCGYNSWAILYAWKNGRISKIWLMD
jgi:hypothetical protein